MKFTIERDAFLAAVGAVRPTVLSNSGIPILCNLKLECAESVTISAHALDCCASVAVAAEIEKPGTITVDAQRLHGLLSGLSAGATVIVDLTELSLGIKSGRSRYRLPTLPAEDFPQLLSIDKPMAKLDLDETAIKRLFRRVEYAVERGGKRPHLQGCYLHPINGKLASCTTDGFVLALTTTDIAVRGAEGVIVPLRAMSQIAKMAGAETAIAWSKNLIQATSGGLTYVSKLIDGTFPDFQRIVPEANGVSIDINRDELLAAFERLNGIDARGPAIATWEGGGTKMTLTRAGLSDGDEEIEIAAPETPGQIPVACGYAVSTLSALTGSAVRIYVPKENAGMLVVDPEDATFTAVVMPAWQWTAKAVAA